MGRRKSVNDGSHKHYHVMIPNEMHERIEDYRWSARKNKTEAILSLIELGLQKWKEEQEKK